MKIFALETDEEKLIKSFLSPDEEIVLEVKFSAFLFIIRSLKALFFTLVFIAVGVALALLQLPVAWTIPLLAILWIPFVGWKWLTAFIDWKFDVLIVTSEEVVLIDQSSLFHVKVRQMNLDNLASVSAESQFANLFTFGKLHFELKEGVGKTLNLPYIPHAQRVASIISDAIVVFQRRRAAMTGAMAQGASPAKAEKIAEAAVPAPAEKEVTDEGVKKV